MLSTPNVQQHEMLIIAMLLPAGLFGLAAAHAFAVLALGMIPSTNHLDSRRAAHVASSASGPPYICSENC